MMKNNEKVEDVTVNVTADVTSESNKTTNEDIKELPTKEKVKRASMWALKNGLQILLGASIILGAKMFVTAPVQVSGDSMLGSFHDKDVVLINKMKSDYDYGDVVVFDTAKVPQLDGTRFYIKRVIGTEGDTIKVENDTLYLNGEKVEESYVNRDTDLLNYLGVDAFTEDFDLSTYTDDGSLTVPKGMYFVMGDNRLNSADSRVFGFIPADSIEGSVYFQVKPLSDVGVK